MGRLPGRDDLVHRECSVFFLRYTLQASQRNPAYGLSTGVVVFDQGKVSPAQTPWLGIQGIVMQTVQSFSGKQELSKRYKRREQVAAKSKIQKYN